MCVCHFSVLGDNVEDIWNGYRMDVGMIDDLLAFLVESLIRNVAEGINYIIHEIGDGTCDNSVVFIDFVMRT